MFHAFMLLSLFIFVCFPNSISLFSFISRSHSRFCLSLRLFLSLLSVFSLSLFLTRHFTLSFCFLALIHLSTLPYHFSRFSLTAASPCPCVRLAVHKYVHEEMTPS